ncbi:MULTISPECIES: DUF6183 family protein [Streptomyces]|uniref:Uncharacterized protein n=1 Tax=Streptomyces viridochromogenes TaxID=1938 RepID=A0A0L8J364_STRVR|nr:MULTISPECIES: DUF6183 family protein [Streptomyces]KOG08086.1 hypothetical protein ADK34_39415 [Streptomyces viridochromogenes]
MTEEIQKIVAELPGLTDVTGVNAIVDERVARGEAAFAADLGIALSAARKAAGPSAWQYEAVLDHLLRLLATTPGPGNAAQALRLVASAFDSSGKGARYPASLLATGHTAEDLAPAFTGSASDELRSCLLQELVLRGAPVAQNPAIATWAAAPERLGHPLSWLPLTLSGIESEAALPSHGVGSSGWATPYGPSSHRSAAAARGTVTTGVVDTTSPAQAAAMAAAVATWTDESNGRVEARVFDLTEPLDAEAIPGALLTLGLECLAGVEKSSGLSGIMRTPAEAWRVLFAAASTGGAYGYGAFGAYGRLATWRSMAALVGSPEDATPAEVEARALDCVWYGFDADTEWFEQVAWDFGLAALSPNRRRLTVLAATDTD